MLQGGQEVIIGAVTDPSFGKLVAFGLGGVLVEVLKDATFRLAPASKDDALSMLDGIAAAEMLKGVRGAAAGRSRSARDDDPARVASSCTTSRRSASSISIRCSRPTRARSPPTCGSSSTRSRRRRAIRPSHDDIVRVDEPDHEAGCRRGDRRVRRSRQDRQLGDEEPDQRRLPGQALSDPPEGRRDHGPQGLQERQGRAGRHRRRGVRDSGEVRRAGARRSRREEDSRRGADSVGLRGNGQRRRPEGDPGRSAASTTCA